MTVADATFDPLDPQVLQDPYPVLAALRDASPVFWHPPTRSWALTRYADCVRVLRDHERFARDRRRAGAVVPEPSLSVQSLDPPDQAGVRSLFMNALRAQDLAAIGRRAKQLLDALFAQFAADQAVFDVMTQVAAPVSVAVICDLLGVEAPQVSSFAAVSDAIMRSMDGGLDPSTVEPGRFARQQLSALVESWFATSGRPGLLDDVRRHSPASRHLDVYIRNTARVMFQGGYSTMVAAVGNAVHTVLRHPQALEEMRHTGRLRTGVEELVRFDGPVQGTSRIATIHCEVGGVQIRAGDTLLILFVAANHDPDQFPQPDRLQIDRAPNRHLGYGWGTHSCIGTTAAQTTLRALVASLLDQPVPLRAAGVPRRRRTAMMRAFDELPATFRS